ncbi:MAG TPA: flavohemoglobin expression-modulating QEGLA motif protein [Gammaproteobacteria bacterium]|nr:flavohemoglobin expression-modulating QEGLA motif protein [Gammaproteobacteria bacterium]
MAATEQSERYRQTLRELSDRIVEAQRPIRILDAIKWDDSIREAFFASGCREMPPVDADYYRSRPLGFDPAEKLEQFHEIIRDINRLLGRFNQVGQIMQRMCQEYQTVVRMLEARGTPAFSNYSQQLYGAASDAFHAGDPTIADLGEMLAAALANLDAEMFGQGEPKTINGEQAVEILQQRLDHFFGDEGRVTVKLSDGIIADAAAGADYLKIRKEALFNERDLRVLEVHEGWVHIGTTLNGLNQPVCTFLSKGPPSSTVTQEGLAILMEIFAFTSYPARLRRLTNRIRGVSMAEEGANFLEVFDFFRSQGMDKQEAYQHTYRIFRGSAPTLGPFTKDLCYSKGFILIYNWIRLAVKRGKVTRIPLLFCGKTTLEDIGTLAQLVEEGIVAPPRYLPPQFADLNAITAWMCYSVFLNRLNLQRIEQDYASIL